ncbi:MAG TPA: circadian clock KaiB family protein [Chloroflexaceae bacterium]|nr:circadian clock KaiB family protein [Chloroflexaceae bacterium]
MKIVLHLYVAGRTPRAERAIATLRAICERELAAYACELLITDVLADPQRAEAYKILATPTLIKEQPAPVRRIIGDLGADPAELLAALSLPPIVPEPPAPEPRRGGTTL